MFLSFPVDAVEVKNLGILAAAKNRKGEEEKKKAKRRKGSSFASRANHSVETKCDIGEERNQPNNTHREGRREDGMDEMGIDSIRRSESFESIRVDWTDDEGDSNQSESK